MPKSVTNFIKRFFVSKVDALREAFICLGLGMRDGFHYKIASLSFIWGAFLSLFWLIIFIIWYRDIQVAALLVAFLIVKHLLAPYFISPAGQLAGVVGAGVGASVMLLNLPLLSAGGIATGILGFLLVLLVYLCVVMLSLRIVLELFLMGKIQKRSLQRYPTIKPSGNTSLRGNFRNMFGGWLWFVLGGLFCLMIPGVGPILLFLLASYLNVRSLVNDALDGISDDSTIRNMIKTNRFEMTLLGILLSLFMLIPLLGFFAPGVIGAATCHFCMRRVSSYGSVVHNKS